MKRREELRSKTKEKAVSFAAPPPPPPLPPPPPSGAVGEEYLIRISPPHI